MEFVPCPHCGADINASAEFCRHCGASDSDGWSDEQDFGDDEYDYDEFVEREFGSQDVVSKTLPPAYRITACLLLLAILLFWVLSF